MKISFRSFLLGLMLVMFFFGSNPSVLAVMKDSDADGLSDEAEIGTYRTDPSLSDTDGDGIGDADEVIDGTDPLDASDSVIADLKLSDPGIFGDTDKFPWYLARATGILSFILLTFVTSFGLVISSRAFMKVIPGADALEFHRTLSWLAFLAVVLHAGSFLFDDFLAMSLPEIVIPFLLNRDFTSALGFDIGYATALGIIALYLILMLLLTSEFRSRMPIRLWRGLHYFSFVAYPIFVAHGFMTGTDSNEWWMRAMYVGSVVLVSGLIVTRIVFRNILPKFRARAALRAQADRPRETVSPTNR